MLLEINLNSIDIFSSLPDKMMNTQNYILLKNKNEESYQIYSKKNKMKKNYDIITNHPINQMKILYEDICILFSKEKQSIKIFDLNLNIISFQIEKCGNSYFSKL